MRAVASQIIKPNDRLTSFERLEIYNRQYWFRVLSALPKIFPACAPCSAGAVSMPWPKRTWSIALRNRSPCAIWVRNWELAAKASSWAGERQNLALDMARLEWADIEAFDGKREPSLKPEDLAGANPAKLRLRLQPYVTLLALRYPVDDLLLEVRKDSDDLDVASNTFSERHKRKRVTAVAKLEPNPIFLAVHRLDEDVYFRRLDREEFAILSALHAGKSLNAAMGSALRESLTALADRAAHVEKWFHTWSALGWFCRPQKYVVTFHTQTESFRKAKIYE